MLKYTLSAILTLGAVALVAEDAAPAAPAAPAAEAKAPVDPWEKFPEVVAEVNGAKITKAEAVAGIIKMIGGKLPENLPEKDAAMALGAQTKFLALNLLIADTAAKEKFAPTDAEIKDFIRKQISSWPQQQLQQYLAAQKLTLDQFVDQLFGNEDLRKGALQQMFLEKAVKIEEASAEDAKKYYDENPAMFVRKGSDFAASHILVQLKANATDDERAAAEKKAADILAQVKADPAKFAEIAQAQSDCPSKAQGGSLGGFNKGDMVPEFEEALAKLQENEISGVVKSQFGYHIIRRDAAPKDEKIPYEVVKDGLVNFLSGQKARQALNAYLDGLIKANNVKFFVDVPDESK